MFIDNHKIEQHSSPFIIAEIGVNHNGSVDLAFELIDAAANAGATAVKSQTFDVDLLLTSEAPQADYQLNNIGKQQTQKEMLSSLTLDETSIPSLIEYSRKKDLIFLSSPFEKKSAEFLHKLGVPAIKIPSGEINNLDFLRYISQFGRPVILSTGMANLGEIENAVIQLRDGGSENICLLHCVSHYPTPPEYMNLRAIRSLATAFNLPVGLSDHSLGINIPVAAVVLGACMIEKHLTLDKNMEGPDHKASLDPETFKAMVNAIKEVRAALGDGVKKLELIEKNTRDVARKSIVASRDIEKGEKIELSMLAFKRPGDGLPPDQTKFVLGRKSLKKILKDQKFVLEELE